jgi:hypothetical protein
VEAGTLAYDATHRALVGSLLDDEGWCKLFSPSRIRPGKIEELFAERM